MFFSACPVCILEHRLNNFTFYFAVAKPHFSRAICTFFRTAGPAWFSIVDAFGWGEEKAKRLIVFGAFYRQKRADKARRVVDPNARGESDTTARNISIFEKFRIAQVINYFGRRVSSLFRDQNASFLECFNSWPWCSVPSHLLPATQLTTS